LKATLSVLLASLTLGGVAYAAIGSAGGGPDKGAAGDGQIRPSVSTSAPAESHSARPSASAPAERPPTAKDTAAHCREYEKLRGRGEALDSTAFQRLVTAAGGEANVNAYCAALTSTADAKGSADANDVNDAGGAKGSGNSDGTGGAVPGKQKGNASGRQNADGDKSRKQ
jgi:hypothetical protein